MSLIILNYIFTTGTTIVASQTNLNNSIIYSDYNGNITDANISPVADIEYTKLALNNTIKSTDILSTTVFSINNIPTLSYSNITQFPYIKVSETEISGTNGGTAIIGTWTNRILNTLDSDTGNISSLSGNQITLPAGTYLIHATSPFGTVKNFQIRLYNATATTNLLLGNSCYNNVGAITFGQVVGMFILTTSSALAIQYNANQNNAATDLGQAVNAGTEVYTVAEFTKVA